MRRHLLRWPLCPLCQGELNLVVANSDRRSVSESDYVVLNVTAKIEHPAEVEIDVITGALTCRQCRLYYSVDNSVPRIQTYSSRVAEIHAQHNTAGMDGGAHLALRAGRHGCTSSTTAA